MGCFLLLKTKIFTKALLLYCLVGEISSLLGKIDIFHNLSGKESKKCEQISVFME